MILTIEINCECGHSWQYKPRDQNHIPKYPHSKCSKCKKDISIKRTKLINSNNYRKIPVRKNHRKKFPYGKNVINLEILKMLGKGLYAQELVQKGLLSPKKLSIIINSFKERGLIRQIKPYPKIYEITVLGKSILTQGNPNQRRIQEYVKEVEKLPEWALYVRNHKIRYKNELVQKPHWLRRITIEGNFKGLYIKRINMKNWYKYIVYLNYEDFNGLNNIEICNNIIIYNFQRKSKDQCSYSWQEVLDYFEAREQDCKKARKYLRQRDFKIGEEEPELLQKPSWAIPTNGDPQDLASLGKYVNLIIKTPTEMREADGSPPNIKGEEETDDPIKVKSYFNMPNELEVVKEEVSAIKEKMDQIVDNTGDKDLKSEISELKEKISEIVEGVKEGIKEGFEKMTQAFIESMKPPKQEIQVETDPGGMFQ